jgi:peptide chain release factor 2
MAASDFWNSQEKARTVIDEANSIKRKLDPLASVTKKVDDLAVLIELTEAESEAQQEKALKEVSDEIAAVTKSLDALEVATMLGAKHDKNNAIITIHAGAGGTESQDWAEMLLRMYRRWAEQHDCENTIWEITLGEGAGIKSATLHVAGEFAYGKLKCEHGVHRLVRISPFDANKRRHTSFAALDVLPEIEDDVDVPIKEEDLKIDTYRSSGAGGQHVNKTESAIRITHLPTGVVVACQNERSQHKNRATAMKMLRAKLYELKEDEKRKEMEKHYGEKGQIAFGSQIRSYVFQPYQMVKDLRTGEQTSNIQKVMDGDIDQFITAWLKAGCPRQRKTGVADEE